jgi:tRNA(Ile)-lysidine synthase
VAVSGGADSVFLLHALAAQGVAVAVLHVNHCLRGPESDADEDFVQALAHEYKLPFRLLKQPVGDGNVEQEARAARFAFFGSVIAEGVCDVVATGHTLDDQAETVLYRFLRGAGTAGLSGIRPVTETGVIRPLLHLHREEIRDYLRNLNIAWREDRSNEQLDFARNRIRLEIMPELMKSLNPSLPDVLAAMADWARAEEDYWSVELERLAKLYLIENAGAVFAKTKPFLELPVAAQRRLLRYAIERVRGSLRAIDFRHTEAIREMMSVQQGSGRVQLPGLDIYRSFDWLRLAPVGMDTRLERDFETTVVIPGRTELTDRQLTIDTELVYGGGVYNNDEQALDWEKCSGSLRLRNWRPGDQYQPRGRSSADKIKTLFQEYRVPLWERRGWPLIVQTGDRRDEILWSREFGVAAGFAAGPESRKILMIREVTESKLSSAASMLMKRAREGQSRHTGEPGAEVL